MPAAEEGFSDADRDSLHTLPLSILPFETPALKRARLVKNSHLESVVEFFSDETAGRGHMEIDAMNAALGWPTAPPHPDLILLRKLARLPSFDVYSLRILLRERGIPIANVDALKLSASKTQELTSYMSSFTRPLIGQVFGDDDVSVQNFEDILALFRDPDVRKAREKLNVLAEKLGIELLEVPRFLEDYGDVFLSLSYYRRCLDDIAPTIEGLILSLADIRSNYQLKQNPHLMKTCSMIEATVNERLAAITGRFENFDLSSKDMWNNISAERFQKVKDMIVGYHTSIGGVLCALTVKMASWKRLFPNPGAGGPMRRSEFIMSDLRQGIDKIVKIEDAVPMLASLD